MNDTGNDSQITTEINVPLDSTGSETSASPFLSVLSAIYSTINILYSSFFQFVKFNRTSKILYTIQILIINYNVMETKP